jgi:hypothetical protein
LETFMTRLVGAALAVTATLLSGCAGIDRGGNAQEAINAAFARAKVCTAEVVNRPEYAAVRAHYWPGDEIPASELADNRRPTPEEARLRVARWDAAAPCRQALLAELASAPANRPDGAQIARAVFAANASVIARSARGDMTWGQSAQAIQAILTSGHAQLVAADAENRREAINRATAAAIISATTPPPHQSLYCSGLQNPDGGPIYMNCD